MEYTGPAFPVDLEMDLAVSDQEDENEHWPPLPFLPATEATSVPAGPHPTPATPSNK